MLQPQLTNDISADSVKAEQMMEESKDDQVMILKHGEIVWKRKKLFRLRNDWKVFEAKLTTSSVVLAPASNTSKNTRELLLSGPAPHRLHVCESTKHEGTLEVSLFKPSRPNGKKYYFRGTTDDGTEAWLTAFREAEIKAAPHPKIRAPSVSSAGMLVPPTTDPETVSPPTTDPTSGGPVSPRRRLPRVSARKSSLLPRLTPMPSYHTIQANGFTFSLPDHYRFTKVLGQGGFGVVVAALDTQANVEVAVKKVVDRGAHADSSSSSSSSRRRRSVELLREIKLLKHFSGHPYILPLHDVLYVDTSSLLGEAGGESKSSAPTAAAPTASSAAVAGGAAAGGAGAGGAAPSSTHCTQQHPAAQHHSTQHTAHKTPPA